MVGVRKIALIGTAPTVRFAPWTDPSWEVWAHASAGRFCKRVDRFFDLHPAHVYRETRKNGQADYFAWLQGLRTPIYMQDKVPAIPASVRYPKERILAEFPRYMSSTFAWMVALALTEGATTLGVFGIHYQFGSEYAEQRAGAEFWLGLAAGRGVQIVNPEGSPLLREPALLYGYETHTPELYAARKAQFRKDVTLKPRKGFDPRQLTPMDDLPADWLTV
jgi:hypothetical protein